MRVRIDATSVLLRSAGIKSYTYYWIQHLKRIAGNDQILPFPFLDHLGSLNHEASILGPVATIPRLALLYFVNIPGNPAIDWLAAGADVFHLSNQLRVPPKNVRLTATLHDLTCWLMPELHTPGNVRADSNFAEHVWKRADGLIAVSENTKRDAVRVLGVDPRKIEVIYSGIPDEYFDAKVEKPARPYVLFLGAIEPRKNVDMLLDAWHMLRPSVREEFDLVIAGATGWSSTRTGQRLRAGIEGVRYLGYVPEAQLPGLMAGATAFVYPSLYEGFGFPVAQAMACGVPVITSNTSCLPEVAGAAALLVDPGSVTELSAALERLLTSPSLQTQLGAEGKEKARNYRWDTCARKSLDFFRRICA